MFSDPIDPFKDSWLMFFYAGNYRSGGRVCEGDGLPLFPGDCLGVSWNSGGMKSYYNGEMYRHWAANLEQEPGQQSDVPPMEGPWVLDKHPTGPLWVVITLKQVLRFTIVNIFPEGK